MDDMDRLLRAMPQESIPPELASSIRLAVRRRHRRRLAIRRMVASLLGGLGVWLLWPGLAWLSSNELFASGAPWLADSLDSLNTESLDLLSRLWSGTLSAQAAVGSNLAVSILLGAVLVCGAVFLALDRASWQVVSGQPGLAGGRTMSASGIHL